MLRSGEGGGGLPERLLAGLKRRSGLRASNLSAHTTRGSIALSHSSPRTSENGVHQLCLAAAGINRVAVGDACLLATGGRRRQACRDRAPNCSAQLQSTRGQVSGRPFSKSQTRPARRLVSTAFSAAGGARRGAGRGWGVADSTHKQCVATRGGGRRACHSIAGRTRAPAPVQLGNR